MTPFGMDVTPIHRATHADKHYTHITEQPHPPSARTPVLYSSGYFSFWRDGYTVLTLSLSSLTSASWHIPPFAVLLSSSFS